MNRAWMQCHLVTAILLSLCCTVERIPPPVALGCGPAMPEHDDSIYAAVIEHMWSHEPAPASATDTLPIYYVVVALDLPPTVNYVEYADRWGDPSPGLLARVAGTGRLVKPVSEAPRRRLNALCGTGASDTFRLFTLSAICWKGPGQVELNVGRRRMRLRYTANRWVVMP
jgi:hypothetical protein